MTGTGRADAAGFRWRMRTRARARPAGSGATCRLGRAAGFRVRCALGDLGARRGILAWIRLAWSGKNLRNQRGARPCVWHARMSVGGANVRLRPEIGRGISLRPAGAPAVRSKGEDQDERSLARELDHAVREAAGRACRWLHGWRRRQRPSSARTRTPASLKRPR